MSKMIQINEVDVTDQSVEYICFGLGSCIGLFVYDRPAKLSGAAHIPLPTSQESGTGGLLDAGKMISQLIDQFKSKGSTLKALSAKLTGGSELFQASQPIGAKNIQTVLKLLTQNGIYIAATDLGGSISRTARFNSSTYELKISTSLKNQYSI